MRTFAMRALVTALLTCIPASSVDGQSGGRVVQDLVIGALAGAPEEVFGNVAGVAVHGDGTIYVLDRSDQRIKVYDRRGTFLRFVGRRGGGPGEFRRPTEIAVHGDTIVVFDAGARRLTRFRHGGSLIDTSAEPVPGLFTFGLARLVSGGYLLGVAQGHTVPPQSGDGSAVLLVLGTDRHAVDTVLVSAGPEQLVYRSDDFISSAATPFGRRPAWSVAADGTIAFGRGDSYQVVLLRHDPDGSGEASRRVGRIRRDLPNRPILKDDIESFRHRLLDDDIKPNLRRVHARMLADYEVPATWPAYRDLLFDDRNRLWVERVWPSSQVDHSIWEVLQRTGELACSMIIPGDIGLEVVSWPHAYGIREDEFGVEYVIRLMLPDCP